MKYTNENEAIKALAGVILSILDDGYTVRGLDVSRVSITRNATPTAEPEPPSAPAIPSGYGGTLSTCCGALTERKGTCEYCVSCGLSNGCS